MKFLKILALSVALLTTAQAVQKPSAHTKGKLTGKPTGQLKPGEYWWNPQLSLTGPLMVLVSIPQQTIHVYRNGILIGRSTVSTGSKGHFYDVIEPGTTVIITDQPVVRSRGKAAILEG
jgi:hypothetical protein